MTQVARCDEGIEAEEREDWLLEEIPQLDRHIQGRIVGCALRPLHPVHDRVAVWIRRTARADRDPRIPAELVDRHHLNLRSKRNPATSEIT
jgi:hypothetical protein